MLKSRAVVGLAVLAVLALGPAVAHAAAPANDNWANAATLPLGTTVQGTTLDATAETGEQPMPGVSSVAEDCLAITDGARCTSSAWYRFEVPTTGTYTIDTCDLGTDVDTVLGVWTGSSPAGLTIEGTPGHTVTSDDECAGGFGTNGSQVSFTAATGTTYWVEVAGFDAAQGPFYLRAYAGDPKPVPEPDTLIDHNNSIAEGVFDGGASASGPRPTASFAFYSDTAGASFQCSFDGSAFAACASPVSLDVAGTHTFSVRSVVAGIPDPTPAQQVYTIDNSPPDTALLTSPPNPTSDTTASTRALASERAYFDQFFCGLDSQPATTTCGANKSYDSLCNGVHTFHTAAVDNASNVDPTPATATFTETGAGAACAPPELGTVTAASSGPTTENFTIPITPPGAGGTMTLEYGTTTAYGQREDASITPDTSSRTPSISFLQPDTVYHYKVTLSTPFGTDTTGDQMFKTSALGPDPIPSITLGTPVVVGHHAAAIPLTVTTGNKTTDIGILMDRGPVSPNSSPSFVAPFDQQFIPASTGPVGSVIDMVDLQPGTYHVRGFADELGSGGVTLLTPDVAFTVPDVPVAAGPPPPSPGAIGHFKFLRGFVKVGRFGRHSKTITLVISHLPPSTSVGVTVRGTLAKHASSSKVKLLGRGRAKAGKGGVARVKVKLSPKARRVLRSKRTRSLALQVRVKPPGQSTSSITLHRRLKR